MKPSLLYTSLCGGGVSSMAILGQKIEDEDEYDYDLGDGKRHLAGAHGGAADFFEELHD